MTGFDAVCIDTMSDSGVAALRSSLSIPVVGPGRASMLTAMMLGHRVFNNNHVAENGNIFTRRQLNESRDPRKLSVSPVY